MAIYRRHVVPEGACGGREGDENQKIHLCSKYLFLSFAKL
jgi:hypothetical protein